MYVYFCVYVRMYVLLVRMYVLLVGQLHLLTLTLILFVGILSNYVYTNMHVCIRVHQAISVILYVIIDLFAQRVRWS